MMNSDRTGGPAPEVPVPAPRGLLGTVWRALLVLVAALAAIAAGGWGTSKAAEIDSRLAAAPAMAAGFVVLATGLSMLRAKPWYVLVPGLAAVAATSSGGLAFHFHLVTDGRIRLDTLGIRVLAGSLAVGLLVTVVGLLVAVVVGHRHPWEAPPKGSGPVGGTAPN
ncbi:hypothetical protein [Kitasatospora sp. NPDC057198]|uniref:hypothetical protein n=1 Tax=Kitasatospora sp. NPDC057198 TaxID=3346046 RepID=UPI00363A0832